MQSKRAHLGQHHHGHGNGHWPGNGHGPCDDDGHGGPSSGGSGGGSSSGGGASSSAGTSSGGASSAGTSSGGAWSAGSGGTGGTPGVCGDSMWGNYEQCDDGNAASGDGCSSQCQLEAHYACDVLGAPCQPVVCGDGQQQSFVHADGTYDYEACDDGNANSGDGCDSACAIESGWICEQPGTACREPSCGDGRQDSWWVPGTGGGGAGGASNGAAGSGVGGGGPNGTFQYEECDDGNATSGDGCTSTCTTETGWLCPQPGVACHQPACGDGIVDLIAGNGGAGGGGGAGGASFSGAGGGYSGGAYEGCDDGNTLPGDGCDASCSVETGWSCPFWEGRPCHMTVCGDGYADYPAEQCDDGNQLPNDGCTSCAWDNQGGGFGGSGGAGFGGFGAGGSGAGGFGGAG